MTTALAEQRFHKTLGPAWRRLPDRASRAGALRVAAFSVNESFRLPAVQEQTPAVRALIDRYTAALIAAHLGLTLRTDQSAHGATS